MGYENAAMFGPGHQVQFHFRCEAESPFAADQQGNQRLWISLFGSGIVEYIDQVVATDPADNPGEPKSNLIGILRNNPLSFSGRDPWSEWNRSRIPSNCHR